MSHGNARLTVHGRLLIVDRVAAGRPVAHIAAELGVSRQTAYRWVRRFRAEGAAGLRDRSSRPRSSPARTSSDLEQAVLDARRSLRFGPLRIAAFTGVPARTVSRILRRHGVPRLADCDPLTGAPIRAARGLQVRQPLAERLVDAARDALTTVDAPVARRVLAADLALLAELSTQIDASEAELARLLPLSPFATLTTTPGWGVVRAGNYGGALGDPHRWPGPSQIYRASGLSPTQYESAGKRRDGSISREGNVALRRALIDLGMGLWFNDAPSRTYAAALRTRGKHGGVIACAMAHRASRIAYAMVRDQTSYDPGRWK